MKSVPDGDLRTLAVASTPMGLPIRKTHELCGIGHIPPRPRRHFIGPFVRLWMGLAILASQASSTRVDFGWAISVTQNTVSFGAGVQQVMG